MQLSILGPSDATKKDIQDAIEHKIRGTDTPGYEIKIVDWRNRGNASIHQERDWRAFAKPLRFADFSIRKNRSSETDRE